MSLTLYFHPLSSFCHKVLIALYENGTPFEGKVVDLMNEDARADFQKIWLVGKFPVLRIEEEDRTIPESSIIIEYLDQHHPGATRFIPGDPDLARQMRFRDRFYDLHLHMPMQKVVTDKLRPQGKSDPHGVGLARKQIATSLGLIERDMAHKTWAMGDTFTMADCAAGPPLFYINMLEPFGETHPNTAAYLQRLIERPSYARALEEAQPYFAMVPR
jgi:glutathione S-transferase